MRQGRDGARATQRLEPLTSLRFFAAAAIVLHHARGLFGIPNDVGRPILLDQAVSFFFVLSGFILAYVYVDLPNRAARLQFWRARFARIWPAHAFALVLAVLLVEEPPETGVLATALLNLAMVHAWLPFEASYFSFNSVSWSISTEFGFYVLFPFLIHRFAATWWWKLAVAGAVVVALSKLAVALELPAEATGWSASAAGLLYVNPLGRVFEFVLGMSMTLLFPRLEAAIGRRVAWGTLIEAAALGLLFTSTWNAASISHRALHAGHVGQPFAIWMVHGGVACASFAVTVLVFACRAGLVSRLLSLRAFQVLGEISFSVYLLHQILIRWYYSRATAFADIPDMVQLVAFTTILLLLSHWVWVAVERPMRDWIAGRGRPQCWPSRRAGAELALIVLLALGIGAVATRTPEASPVAAPDLERLRAATEPAARDARFGEVRVLRAARITQQADGVRIELAWEAEDAPADEATVAIHVVDAGGTILAQADYRQDALEADHVVIDTRELSWRRYGPEWIGVAVVAASGAALPVDRGERDWHGNRLLLALPDP